MQEVATESYYVVHVRAESFEPKEGSKTKAQSEMNYDVE